MGDSTVHGFDSTEATVAIFTAKSEEYRAFCLELEGFGEWNVEKEDEYSEEGLVGEIFFLSHKRNEGAKMNVFVWKLDDEQGSIPAAASITNVMNTFKPRFFSMVGYCGTSETHRLGDVFVCDGTSHILVPSGSVTKNSVTEDGRYNVTIKATKKSKRTLTLSRFHERSYRKIDDCVKEKITECSINIIKGPYALSHYVWETSLTEGQNMVEMEFEGVQAALKPHSNTRVLPFVKAASDICVHAEEERKEKQNMEESRSPIEKQEEHGRSKVEEASHLCSTERGSKQEEQRHKTRRSAAELASKSNANSTATDRTKTKRPEQCATMYQSISGSNNHNIHWK
mmetsp:Transcript_39677/g.101969  ORF Transcript_39677/g.101969 Transcript_39677/m.101969 type:complete len:341 (+) Transcript_39677:752-1774(+)